MQKGEALERLCKLIDSVREDVFCNQQEGDCICGRNNDVSHPVVGEGVMTFIERAVTNAIETEVENFKRRE